MTQEEKKYRDARNDLLKAAKSVRELTPKQKEELAKELFGMELVQAMCLMMKQLGF